jgi:hypothetical protein
MVNSSCIRIAFVDFNIHIWNCMNSVAVLRHSLTYVWVSWKPWDSWKNSVKHVKGFTLKVNEAGSFKTLMTSFQTTHRYMQMTWAFTLCFCGKGSLRDCSLLAVWLKQSSRVQWMEMNAISGGQQDVHLAINVVTNIWRKTKASTGNHGRKLFSHSTEALQW